MKPVRPAIPPPTHVTLCTPVGRVVRTSIPSPTRSSLRSLEACSPLFRALIQTSVSVSACLPPRPCRLAPEVIRHDPHYTGLADSYSFGVMLNELVSAAVPYAHDYLTPLQVAFAVG
jgi:hypothetical protein